jgi:hypothetical protein
MAIEHTARYDVAIIIETLVKVSREWDIDIAEPDGGWSTEFQAL